MNSTICSAIRSRRVVQFDYDGGLRTAEPFCHGASMDGHDLLRAYQTGGYSESGNSVGWRLFRVDRMNNLNITDESFSGNRPGYNPDDGAMVRVYCRL
jgi:predicted DNA-binding transcriptional regulator YafY